MISPGFALSRSGFEGSSKLYELIQKTGKPKFIKKGKTIIREGSPATFMIYVKKGIFKTIVKGPKKNFILAFTFDDDFDCCPRSLLNKVPNNFNIEAVTDCEVLICKTDDMKKIAGKQEYQQLVANILAHYAGFLEEQLFEFFNLTAEERYTKLIKTQPDKINSIPITLMASYLGITVERLSRIRKKLKHLT